MGVSRFRHLVDRTGDSPTLSACVRVQLLEQVIPSLGMSVGGGAGTPEKVLSTSLSSPLSVCALRVRVRGGVEGGTLTVTR